MSINRESELEQLSRHYDSGQAELFVIYGRRRVGKTELLREFCENKPHIFFTATFCSENEQLASFSQQIWKLNHPETPEGFSFPSWEAAFHALADLPDRPVIVMDEFTYLISSNKAIPFILQKVWDEILNYTKIMLVLSGSYTGMMGTEVLGKRAPLYGRYTASLLLHPRDLPFSANFFKNYYPQEQLLAWSVLGGIPYYLLTFTDSQDIFANIDQHILNPCGGLLFNEPLLLLMEEFREPYNYFSILHAIAQGHTRLNEITHASRVGSVNSVSSYLDILQQMQLVTRHIPATEIQPEKSKKGMYQINDHFLRFWFRYVYPNKISLDLGSSDVVLEKHVRPDLNHFTEACFKEASRTYIASLLRRGGYPFLPERVGSWWSRNINIDVMAIDQTERLALVGECECSDNPMGIDILQGLQQKMQTFIQECGMYNFQYALFSKTGFTSQLKEQAKRDDIKLITLEDIIEEHWIMLSRWR